MGEYFLVEKLPSLEEYQSLRVSVGWELRDELATKIALQNSLYSVCMQHRDRIIGYGRVIGDGGLHYYIQDIIVLPEYQRQGIGKQIMTAIMEYIETHAPKGAFIGLMAASGVSGFYETYGFTVRSSDRPGMCMWK